MFGGPWWQDLVWGVAWLATMTLVMGWLAKSRLRPVTCTEDGVLLRYPRSYLGIGLVCTFLFHGFAVFSLYAFSSDSEKLKYALFFVAFSMLGWPIVAGYFIESHEVGPEGVRYRTSFGRQGFFAWSQVNRVDYSYGMKWFRLHAGGKIVRFSALLVGLPELARAIEQYAPDAVRDTQVRELLATTAGGSPPSPWP